MAHGFRREPGTGRGYINVDNPNFAPGVRLSRRAYDKMAESIGARSHRPRLSDLRVRMVDTQTTLRATQTEIARLAGELVQSPSPEARGRLLAARRRQRQAQQQEAETARLLEREDRTAKGLRRYHAALQSYLEEQRARGRRLSAKEAANDPAFKEALRLLKGKPNPRGSERIRQENAEGRKRAVATLGGSAAFKEVYDRRYGQRVTRVHRSGAGSRRRA